MKIKKVEIEGFRAYREKPDGIFDFTTTNGEPANFISIYAPNGFGKSSFFDAVEWAMTNNLERYIREPFRTFNEAAARGTKIPDVPQYILRNKDISDDIVTSVNIETTLKEFSNTPKTTPKNSKDLRLTEDQTTKGTKELRHIFLSQDSIDSFLREIRPEDRYTEFMAHFGCSAEDTRKELSLIANENNAIIDALNKELKQIEINLEKPVNKAIFEAYNKTSLELQKLNETIENLTEDFSEIQEYGILAHILSRNNDLDLIIQNAQSRIELIKLKLNKLDEIKRTKQHQNSLLLNLEKTKQGLSNLSKYENITAKIINEKNELNLLIEKINYSLELKASLPRFIEEYTNITTYASEKNKLEANKNTLLPSLTNAKVELEKLTQSMSNINETMAKWLEVESKAESVFTEISTKKNILSGVNFDLAKIKDNIITAEITSKQNEDLKSKIQSQIVHNHVYASQVIWQIGVSQEEADRLYAYNQSMRDISQRIDLLHHTQNELNSQAGNIEKLVSIGLEIICSHPQDNCPLCHTKFPSFEYLKLQISENLHVSEAIKNNALLMEDALREKNKVNEAIDEILQRITQLKNSKLDQIQTYQNSVQRDLEEQKTQLNRLEVSSAHLQEEINSLQLQTLNLDAPSLHSKIKTEKENISAASKKIKIEISEATKNIELYEGTINDINARISYLTQIRAAISETSSYKQHSSILTTNNIDPINANSFYNSNINELENTRNEIKNKINDLDIEAKTLYEKIKSDDNFKNTSEFINYQLNLEAELSNVENELRNYTQDLSSLLDTRIDGLPYNLAELMDLAIRKNLEVESATKNKISLYETLNDQLLALAPYMEHLKFQSRKSEIDKEIHKHIQLGQRLNEELQIVIEHLHNQIKSFFYTDLIDIIYKKIDPHPSFKKVQFDCTFELNEKPKLNVVIIDEEKGERISPNLYFSAAQLNILSLSIFLAKALHAKFENNPLDVILIDDPIHSMDSINILSMIDLLRSISIKFNKQIIISTHDENFYELLKKKIPSEIFSSKFLKLPTYGKVMVDEQ